MKIGSRVYKLYNGGMSPAIVIARYPGRREDVGIRYLDGRRTRVSSKYLLDASKVSKEAIGFVPKSEWRQ